MSYLNIRGRSREDPMPEGRRPRGVIPGPRSGAVGKSTRLRRHRNGQEELSCVQGQGVRPRGVTPRPRSGAAGKRSYPASEVRSSDREEIPHAPSPRPGAVGGRSYPTPTRQRPRAAAGRSNPTPEARGSGREDQPHILRGRRRA